MLPCSVLEWSKFNDWSHQWFIVCLCMLQVSDSMCCEHLIWLNIFICKVVMKRTYSYSFFLAILNVPDRIVWYKLTTASYSPMYREKRQTFFVWLYNCQLRFYFISCNSVRKILFPEAETSFHSSQKRERFQFCCHSCSCFFCHFLPR